MRTIRLNRQDLNNCIIALKHFLMSANLDIVRDDEIVGELRWFKEKYSDTLEKLEGGIGG